jgi:hypothetical protein
MKLVWISAITILLPTVAVLHAKENPRLAPPKTHAIAGVTWTEGLESAKKIARQTNKPILLLQMFGSLDEEFC